MIEEINVDKMIEEKEKKEYLYADL